MAIKGGQILHVSGGFVIDRIQTGGVSGINVNEERLEELGNYQAIGTVRDIPDLTFELESFDATTELESILTGGDNTEPAGYLFNLTNTVPINILSPFKASGVFTVEGGVIVPFLTLESMSYSFSLSDPATMSATLRGDSVFYVPGTVWEQKFNGTGVLATFNFGNGPAYKSAVGGDDYYALSVTVDGKRQRLGIDYTNTDTGIVFESGSIPGSGTGNVVVTYGSGAASTYAQSVHTTSAPVGVRGRDVFVSLDGGGTWLGVQSANIDWSVSLERDEEFGNPFIVSQDYDTPDVTGSVTMKPADVDSLFLQIQEIAGLTGTDIANATQDPPELELQIRTVDANGVTTKVWEIPDAKFVVPQIQGSVGSKLEVDFSFTSGGGVLNIYKGIDTTPPVIELVGANPQTLTEGGEYVELGATAVDALDGDLTDDIVIDSSAVNMAVPDTYQVTYNVTDAAGNPATQVTRTVIVEAA